LFTQVNWCKLKSSSKRRYSDSRTIPISLSIWAWSFFFSIYWAKAIENYKKSLLVKPNQIDPLYYMAQATIRVTNLILARETIARAAELAPDNPTFARSTASTSSTEWIGSTEGLKWLEKARALTPIWADRLRYWHGANSILNDLRSAAVSFQAALKEDPASGEAAYFLGESLSGIGDWEKARDTTTTLSRVEYSSGSVYYGLGTRWWSWEATKPRSRR